MTQTETTNRAGWSVGYRDGWTSKIVARDLDIEAALELAGTSAAEIGISHSLFPPDGSAGLSGQDAHAAVFGAAPATPLRPAPMGDEAAARAWADGPGRDDTDTAVIS